MQRRRSVRCLHALLSTPRQGSAASPGRTYAGRVARARAHPRTAHERRDRSPSRPQREYRAHSCLEHARQARGQRPRGACSLEWRACSRQPDRPRTSRRDVRGGAAGVVTRGVDSDRPGNEGPRWRRRCWSARGGSARRRGRLARSARRGKDAPATLECPDRAPNVIAGPVLEWAVGAPIAWPEGVTLVLGTGCFQCGGQLSTFEIVDATGRFQLPKAEGEEHWSVAADDPAHLYLNSCVDDCNIYYGDRRSSVRPLRIVRPRSLVDGGRAVAGVL